MLLFPNAKLNLGLRILEKRSDGFHNIETIFLPFDLTDALEFVETGEEATTISITGIMPEGQSQENLVMKAWQIMNEKFRIPPVTIHLHKIIPVGAGLGGGSADAAFMLKALNEYFGCGCTDEDLKKFAAKLGSDCAFFMDNKPMLGTGRGEVLRPIEISIRNYDIILIKPDIHVATHEAYSCVIPAKPEKPLTELIKNSMDGWQGLILNDFEISVFKKYPEIGIIKDRLLKMGAVYASMSGSGSAVYGIFEPGIGDRIYRNFKNCFIYKGKIRG